MSERTSMSIYLSNEKTKKYLQSILGERTNQFITSLTSLASSSNYLKNCDRNSLLACALKAASMDLPFDPNLGFAWAVPYKNTATFQIGCKGYIQLALRTGRYKALNSRDVREGEFVGRDFVGDPIIEWIPDDVRPEKPIIGYMAGMELTNRFRKIIFGAFKRSKTTHSSIPKAFVSTNRPENRAKLYGHHSLTRWREKL